MVARFEVVIFDCDGVLVDSERITNRVFAGMLNELGVVVTLEDMFETFMGRSMAQCLARVEDVLGRTVPVSFADDYRRRTRAALESELEPMPGVADMLDVVSIPSCVASSGSHEKMRITLGLVGLLPRFEGRLFSVHDVERGKPAPDVFRHAAECLGAAPAACAVVEDSPPGVSAGVAAGMSVFGYAASTPARRLREAGARRTFDDMRALPALLAGKQ